MKRAELLLGVAVSLAMALASHAARATTITTTWFGATVSITHPDSVIQGQTFDVSFSVDTSTADPSITLTFATYLDATDSIDIAGCTWDYLFISDDPVWNLSFSGTLGDATTPTTHGTAGYSTRFYDPINGNYTWLWSDYHDQVVWTLHDLVLLDDTSFDLTLAPYLMTPVTFSFDVPLANVPTLPRGALAAAGLCLLAAAFRPLTAPERRSPAGVGGFARSVGLD